MVWKRIKLAFCVDWEEKKKEMEFKQCQALTNSCNEKKSGLRIPLIHPQRKKKIQLLHWWLIDYYNKLPNVPMKS